MRNEVNPIRWRKSAQAMSLLEILLVVALVAIMASLVLPAFVSIAQGSGMKRAVVSVSDSLEQARTEAMATSTWVLIGFSQDDTAVPPNLTIMTVASKDGTANTLASNLMPIAKPIRVDSVRILDSARTTNGVLLKGSKFEFSATVAGKPRNFKDTVIAFSPQGEAVLEKDVLAPWIEIPLSEIRGSQVMTNRQASIRVSGPSGQVIVGY